MLPFSRWIAHYKSPTNKHLVLHSTVYHQAMVAEGLVQLRVASEAIGAEVKVLFDEDNYEIDDECVAKLEVRIEPFVSAPCHVLSSTSRMAPRFAATWWHNRQ